MPAAEVEGVDEQEIASYELAFHVLPTVAEGEVTNVFQSLKDAIIKHNGTLGEEEVPERFDLAYEIIKYLEGRNRKFTSAYFGWVRFSVHPTEIAAITEAVEGQKELLRHLMIRLTRSEEEYPFLFHEALDEEEEDEKDAKAEKKVAAEVTEEVEKKEEVKEDGEEGKDKV